MLRCKAKPYTKGDEKYIFVSYSHKDSARVFPIIEKLSDEGFRVWYDEGIDPGTEWPETIAKHLSGASCFIAFISQNALESNECRREINFAFRKKLGFISVFLEEVELSPGMEMQLSNNQSIFKYKIPQEEFYEKIIRTEMLQECKINKKEEKDKEEQQEEKTKTKDKENKEGKEDEKEEGQEGVNKKKTLVFAVCVIALLAIAFGVVFGLGLIKPQTKNENVYHVTLTAKEGLADDLLREDIATLKGRLNVLCGKQKYSLDVDGETIQLVLPKSVFGEEDPASVFRCYISRSIKLYAVNYDEKSEFEEIQRNAIDKIELLYGKIDGIKPEDYEITTDEYSYLKISFSEEVAKKLKRLGDHMVFAQDINNNVWAYYYTIPAPGKNEFYIINNDKGNNIPKLLFHNLQRDPLNGYFTFIIDLNDWAEWETANKNEFGEKQCEIGDFTEKTLTFTLKGYADYTEGTLADDIRELKSRLDILGEPYAFGRINKGDDYTYFAIRTTVSQMDNSIIYLLGTSYSGNIYLLSNLTKEPVYEYNDKEQRFSGESTSFGFSVKIRKEKEVLNALLKEAVSSGNKKIYLRCGDYALFETEATSEFKEDSISFSNFAYNGNRLSPAAGRIVDLLNRVELFSLHHSLEVDEIWFDKDDKGETASENDFLCSPESPEEEFEDLKKEYDLSVNGNEIRVKLHLPFDKNLVKNSLQTAKKLYKATDFEHGYFQRLSIYFTDEEGAERTRIFFHKFFADLSDGEKGYTYVYGIFTNGRAEEYKNDFLKAISADPFYERLNKTKGEDFSDWITNPF